MPVIGQNVRNMEVGMSADNAVGIYVCEDGELISVEAAALEQYALEREWTNTRTYADKLVPGMHGYRPALTQLIQDCRQGCLSGVVIWRISQLGDNIRDVISFLEQFRQCVGLQFLSVQESIDSLEPAASGRLFFAHVAIFANVEREMNKARQRSDFTDQAVGKEASLLSPEGSR
jgi:DNA invertase Pin-like site-specific DNA recombinase